MSDALGMSSVHVTLVYGSKVHDKTRNPRIQRVMHAANWGLGRDEMLYLWKRIHWPTVEMASWVSLSDESLALRLSSVKAMMALEVFTNICDSY